MAEYAIEVALGELEREEVLLPHFATFFPRHYGETGASFQAYGGVTELGKRLEIASRPAAKVEDRKWWVPLDVLQQRCDVLADIVSARAFPEILGSLVIVLQRQIGDALQVVRIQFCRRQPGHVEVMYFEIDGILKGCWRESQWLSAGSGKGASMTVFSGLRARRFRVVLLAVGLLFSPVVALGGWAIGVRVSGNVHEVEPGQLYRSAQLSGPFLNEVIDHYGVRTVINLRGRNPGTDWYRDEMAITARKGITHIDIGMSANKEPDAATIDQLIEAFKIAPKPILIHCEAGADRSGLASAMYELLIAHRSASEADRQLSFFYGHFPWLTSKTGAMDNAFIRIAASTH